MRNEPLSLLFVASETIRGVLVIDNDRNRGGMRVSRVLDPDFGCRQRAHPRDGTCGD